MARYRSAVVSNCPMVFSYHPPYGESHTNDNITRKKGYCYSSSIYSSQCTDYLNSIRALVRGETNVETAQLKTQKILCKAVYEEQMLYP